MKSLHTIILLLIFLFPNKIFANHLTACGTHDLEKVDQEKEIDWVKSLDLKYKGGFFSSSGIVCAGISKRNLAVIEKIVYRDSNKIIEKIYTNNILKTAQPLLESSSFQGKYKFIQWFLKKNTIFVKIQLLDEDENKKLSSIRLIFLRNLGGNDKNDYRYFDIYAFRDDKNKTVKMSFDDKGNKEIDLLEFDLSFFGGRILSVKLWNNNVLLETLDTRLFKKALHNQ